MRRIAFILLVCALTTLSSIGYAQVTTSSITGVVKNDKNEALTGATVVLTHVPTGSVFTTTTRTGGRFDVPNIPPGGPYTVKITFVGFTDFTRSDIGWSFFRNVNV